MDQCIEGFIEDFGEPTLRRDASSEVITKYRGVLPDRLLEYWQRLGFSSFKNGLFFVTNPDDYADILASWLQGTSAEGADEYHVIARSGFGDLYVWAKTAGNRYKIEAKKGRIFENNTDAKIMKERSPDFCMELFFGVIKVGRCDCDDEKRRPLFERAVKKLEPLDPDEVFAFEPALCAGGKANLANIKKRNIHVHLPILLGLCEKDYISPDELNHRAFNLNR